MYINTRSGWFILASYLTFSESMAKSIARWWFQTFFIFTPTWGYDPIWLIFVKWVETTTYKMSHLQKKQPKRILFSCWFPLHFTDSIPWQLTDSIKTHHVGNTVCFVFFPISTISIRKSSRHKCRLLQACSMMSIILCMFFLGRALSFFLVMIGWMHIWRGCVYSRSLFSGFMIHFHLTSIWENMFGTFQAS